MTKADFIAKMQANNPEYHSRSQAEIALDVFLSTLTETLRQGESVSFSGFGSFKVAKRAARVGRNPRTGGPVSIPARVAVRFTPGKNLKEAVN